MPLLDKFSTRGRSHEGRSEIESILDNLEHVLNTKRGFGALLPNYGISTLTEYTSRDDVAKAVMAEIRENIETYEPRLRVDSIAMDDREPTPFWLSFTLQCSLIHSTQVVRVSVSTLFGTCEINRD